MQEIKRKSKRIATAIIGGVVLVVGVIAIPYPGPGWLIVFTGLAILATEFAWAGKILQKARHEYGRWQAWVARQHAAVRIALLVATGLVVVMTLWFLNVYGMADNFFNLQMPWLHSPLGFLN